MVTLIWEGIEPLSVVSPRSHLFSLPLRHPWAKPRTVQLVKRRVTGVQKQPTQGETAPLAGLPLPHQHGGVGHKPAPFAVPRPRPEIKTILGRTLVFRFSFPLVNGLLCRGLPPIRAT